MEAIVQWFVDLYIEIRYNIYLLKIEHGIEPAVTITLAAIILVILIVIICSIVRHRKMKKVIQSNSKCITDTNKSIHTIYNSIDSISKNIEQFDDKLNQVEIRLNNATKEDLPEYTNRRYGPEIIYIDNRQMTGNAMTDKEEIISNINSAISTVPEPKQNAVQPTVITNTDNCEFKVDQAVPIDFNEKLTEDDIMPKTEKRIVYRDRNFGVNKNGIEYTEEQLQKQIKD